MGEIVADDLLAALSTSEYRALLERLPDQADELRKRRKALQHAAWRERNRDTKHAWDMRYYHVTSQETPEQRRERWKAATRRLRARRKREELEREIIELNAEMKGTRGKQRELLKARLHELGGRRLAPHVRGLRQSYYVVPANGNERGERDDVREERGDGGEARYIRSAGSSPLSEDEPTGRRPP